MRKYEFIHRDDAPQENYFEKLPELGEALYVSRHESGHDTCMKIFWFCGEDLFFTDRKILLDAGYELWQENQIGNNRFCTLVNDEFQVHLGYYPAREQLRMTVEKRSTLPIRPQDNLYTDRGVRPSVTQLWMDYSDADCSMSYCIQLCDGSFVIIDGGWNHHNEAQNLYDFMCSKIPEGEKPVIAGWILTHHHPDHVKCFEKFAEDFQDKAVVEAIIYNNPAYGKAKRSETLVNEYINIEKAVEKFPESTKLYRPHTGEVYYIRDAVFTCYCTQEELSGQYDVLANTNNTSIVFRMTLGSKSVMWLGDTGRYSSLVLIPAYKDALKSDIVQVAHHGYGDIIEAIYPFIGAKVALWPVPDYRQDVIPRLEKYLREKAGVETIYFAHDKTYTLEM